MGVIAQSVALGVAVLLAGTLPRDVLFALNMVVFPSFPWAVPIMAAYLWVFWRYVNGVWPADGTAAKRRAWLRAERLSGRVWAWSLLAGTLGLVTLVLALRVANRVVMLPPQPSATRRRTRSDKRRIGQSGSIRQRASMLSVARRRNSTAAAGIPPDRASTRIAAARRGSGTSRISTRR